ncbi:hypothetical protein CYMTET_11960 [Cymbomonas tetramitiformis]|uniref:RNA helicase n=1 Tax=Cymbomonas tetramitiformis TaxID=36881 RepID=A0AAE0GL22_9CHLO|nr:hypothetical protein CYMTET_11960 [Cymbomonas tetramitiformis]
MEHLPEDAEGPVRTCVAQFMSLFAVEKFKLLTTFEDELASMRSEYAVRYELQEKRVATLQETVERNRIRIDKLEEQLARSVEVGSSQQSGSHKRQDGKTWEGVTSEDIPAEARKQPNNGKSVGMALTPQEEAAAGGRNDAGRAGSVSWREEAISGCALLQEGSSDLPSAAAASEEHGKELGSAGKERGSSEEWKHSTAASGGEPDEGCEADGEGSSDHPSAVAANGEHGKELGSGGEGRGSIEEKKQSTAASGGEPDEGWKAGGGHDRSSGSEIGGGGGGLNQDWQSNAKPEWKQEWESGNSGEWNRSDQQRPSADGHGAGFSEQDWNRKGKQTWGSGGDSWSNSNQGWSADWEGGTAASGGEPDEGWKAGGGHDRSSGSEIGGGGGGLNQDWQSNAKPEWKQEWESGNSGEWNRSDQQRPSADGHGAGFSEQDWNGKGKQTWGSGGDSWSNSNQGWSADWEGDSKEWKPDWKQHWGSGNRADWSKSGQGWNSNRGDGGDSWNPDGKHDWGSGNGDGWKQDSTQGWGSTDQGWKQDVKQDGKQDWGSAAGDWSKSDQGLKSDSWHGGNWKQDWKQDGKQDLGAWGGSSEKWNSGWQPDNGGNWDKSDQGWKSDAKYGGTADQDPGSCSTSYDGRWNQSVAASSSSTGYGTGGAGAYSYKEEMANPSQMTQRYQDASTDDIDSLFAQLGMGIDFDVYDEIEVETGGDNVPAPISSFKELDRQIAPMIMENIKLCKYEKPTPVQRYSFPIILRKRDLMACAQTGSGKTAAFMLPIISGMLERGLRAGGRGANGGGWPGRTKLAPAALVVSPTRELAIQLHEQAAVYMRRTGLRAAVVYGGVPMGEQMRDVERNCNGGGCELLVGTPGRLNDMRERERLCVRGVHYLCLDEADRMLDMGFEPQIKDIIEKGGMLPKGQRQTLMFSATFPQEVQRLAFNYLHDYVFLCVGRVGSSTQLIDQHVEYVDRNSKWDRLRELLSEFKKHKTVVFVQTKRAANDLERWIWDSLQERVCAVHSDRTQLTRDAAMKSFRKGGSRVLVATDVAARGMDVPDLMHVINFDFPGDIDTYVHRIGRTGRAGKKGRATSLLCDSDFSKGDGGLMKSLIDILEESEQGVPDWLYNWTGREPSSAPKRSAPTPHPLPLNGDEQPRPKAYVPHLKESSSSSTNFGASDFRKMLQGLLPE